MSDLDPRQRYGPRRLPRRALFTTALTLTGAAAILAACRQSEPATPIPFGAPDIAAKPTETALSTAIPATVAPARSPDATASPAASPAASEPIVAQTETVTAGDIKDFALQKLITNPNILMLRKELGDKGIPLTLSYQFSLKAGVLVPQEMSARVREEDTDRQGINFRQLPVLDPVYIYIYYDVAGFSPGDWINYTYHLTTGKISIPNSTTVEWVAAKKRSREGFAAIRETRTDPQANIISDRSYVTPLDYGMKTAIVTSW